MKSAHLHHHLGDDGDVMKTLHLCLGSLIMEVNRPKMWWFHLKSPHLWPVDLHYQWQFGSTPLHLRNCISAHLASVTYDLWTHLAESLHNDCLLPHLHPPSLPHMSPCAHMQICKYLYEFNTQLQCCMLQQMLVCVSSCMNLIHCNCWCSVATCWRQIRMHMNIYVFIHAIFWIRSSDGLTCC